MPEETRPFSGGLTKKRVIVLAAIGALATLLLAAFLYAAGAVSPERLAPRRFIDALEARDGVHDGFRRAHSKGVCAIGRFHAAGDGAEISSAGLFQPDADIPVTARFSTGGGMPYAPDGRNVFRSVALKFDLSGGEEFRMAMNHVPIFIVANPATFPELHLAYAPDPATGKPDPEKVAQFFATHPETAPFQEWIRTQPLPSSFANSTFYSANAFRFIDGAGTRRYVRWRFEPADEKQVLDKATLANLPANFLFEDIAAGIEKGPARWTMIATLAEPNDVVDNPTIVWTGEHREIVMGELEIASLVPEDEGDCRNVNFDPLILPRGIEPSDDPVLFARSAAYSVSLTRRLGEKGEPAAFSFQKTN
jgi:catalase